MVKNLLCLATLAVAVVLAAACERTDRERRTDTKPDSTPPTTERPSPETGIQWAGTYDNALKMARESNKPVMAITVSADDEDSRAIENDLLTNSRVQDLSKQFISVKLDASKEANLPDDVKNPGEIVFLGSDGKKIDSYKGRDAQALAEKMEDVLQKNAERKDQGFAQPMQGDQDQPKPPDDNPQQPPPPSPQPPQEAPAVAAVDSVWLRMDHSDAIKIAKDGNKLMLHIECTSTEHQPKDRPQQMQGQDEPKPEQPEYDRNSYEYINFVILRDERVVKSLPNYVVMAIEKPITAQADEKKGEAQAAEVRTFRFVILDAEGCCELKVVEDISADALAQALEECVKMRDEKRDHQQEPGPKPDERKLDSKEKVWVMLSWNEAMSRAKEQNKNVLLFVVQPNDAGFTGFARELHKDAALLEKLNDYVVIKVFSSKDLAGLPADVKDRAAGKTTILILDADAKVTDTIDVNIDTFRSKIGVEKKDGMEEKKDQDMPKDDEKKDQVNKEEKAQEPSPPAPGEGGILWVLDKDDGLKRAKEENKLAMIVYVADKDESTDRLMGTAFADKRVIDLSKQFVVIRQDLGFAHRHDGKTMPHVHIVTSDDKEVASLMHIDTTEHLIDVMKQALEKRSGTQQ